MELCYDYFQCKKKECPANAKDSEAQCWEIDNTLCNSPPLNIMLKHDKNKCDYCQYYKFKHPV